MSSNAVAPAANSAVACCRPRPLLLSASGEQGGVSSVVEAAECSSRAFAVETKAQAASEAKGARITCR
jgi:hypothetical protein